LDNNILNTNKNEDEDVQNIEVTFEEIIAVASGMTEDGLPASTSSLVINNVISPDEIHSEMEVQFGETPVEIFASGGCIVMQFDFTKTHLFDFNRAMQLCSTYFENISNEEYENTRHLILTVFPFAFYGDLIIACQDLVYFTALDLPDNGKRLLLCFNNNVTQCITTDGFDYNRELVNIDNEIKREYNELVEKVADAEEEVRRLENTNSYEEKVKSNMSYQNIMNQEETRTTTDNSWMRSSDDNE
jgi:hypothetical protein